MEMHTLNAQTAQEEAECRLIALLLVNAKFIQSAVQDALLRKSPDGTNVQDFLLAVAQVSKADGVKLETDTLALAARLGIQVQQSYTNPTSGGVN